MSNKDYLEQQSLNFKVFFKLIPKKYCIYWNVRCAEAKYVGKAKIKFWEIHVQ